jgi:hypothetical protein
VACRACGFNRQYCQDACAEVARKLSVVAARLTYRTSDAGRDQHRDEQREYRALKKRGAVGDQLSRTAVEAPIVSVMTDAIVASAGRVREEAASWRVIVEPALVAEAERLLFSGEPVSCIGCGHAARVRWVVLKKLSPWASQRRDVLKVRQALRATR